MNQEGVRPEGVLAALVAFRVPVAREDDPLCSGTAHGIEVPDHPVLSARMFSDHAWVVSVSGEHDTDLMLMEQAEKSRAGRVEHLAYP